MGVYLSGLMTLNQEYHSLLGCPNQLGSKCVGIIKYARYVL